MCSAEAATDGPHNTASEADVSAPTPTIHSASNATEPNATANARTPLEDLITRAEQASKSLTTNKRNRALIREMAIALVSQAALIVGMSNQITEQRKAAEDRRIILPGN